MSTSIPRSTLTRRSNLSTRILRAALVATPAIAALSVLAPAEGASKYWDLNATNPGATDDAGGVASGVWDDGTVGFNWNVAADGTGAGTFMTAIDTAIFSAGTNATGSSNITVSGPQASIGLTVQEGTLTFAGDGLQLDGTTGAAALSVSTGASATFNNALSGAFGLTKSAGGTAVFNGVNTMTGALTVTGGTLRLANTNAFTGNTTITGGTLILDNSTNNNTKVDSTGSLEMGSGTLSLIGINGAADTSQAFSALNLTSSTSSRITVTKGDTQNTNLNVGAITRGALALTDFALAGTGPGTASITTSTTNTDGILGKYATFDRTGWATVAGGNIVALTTYATNDFSNLTNNVDVTSSQSPAADFNVNTIRINTGGVALNLSGSNNTTGAILIGSGVGAAGASLTGGGITAPGELIIHQHNTAADFVVDAAFTGSAAVTKGGAGTMTLNGSSSNASFAIVGGQLKVGANERIGNSTNVSVSTGASVNLNGFTETVNQLTGFGTLTPNGGTLGIANTAPTTFNGPVSLGATGGTFTQPNAATEFTAAGTISGSARWTKSGPGTMVLGNTGNTFTGGFRVTEGVLVHSTFEGANDSGVNRASGFVPTTVVPDYVILDGGSIKYNNAGIGSTFLSTRKGITLTENGGALILDAGISIYYGKVSAPNGGTLYKRGAGEIRASHISDPAQFTPWEQTQLVVEGGLFRIANVGGETGFGAVPAALKADAIVLAGTGHDRASGGVGIATTIPITTPATRGITMNAFGGTLATSIGAGNAWTIQSPITGGTASSALNINGNGFPVSGAGAFETASSLIVLSGANTYLGATKVNVGTLVVQGGAAIPDTSPVIMNAAAAATADLRVDANETIGSLSGGNATFGNVILNGGSLTTGADNSSATFDGLISGNGGLTKTGSGTQTLPRANTYTGATAANGGKLLLMQPLTNSPAVNVSGTGTIEMASNGTSNNVIKTGTVTATGAGKIDLKDNKLFATSPVGTFSAGAYNGVSGLVDSARGNLGVPAWNGPGITTSDPRAQNSNLVSIGVAKVGDVKGIADGATTTFGGQSVLGSDTVAMVTWGGDATMDGKINIDDYGRIDANVAQSGTVFGWYNGDFNYDGAINIDDYGIIDGNISSQGTAFPTSGSGALAAAAVEGVSAVPEPSAAIVLAAVGLLHSIRRRRGAN